MADRWELPEDMVIDILSMLPVKSLLRFKCVCKHWCALITSPSFITLHLSRASLRKSDYMVFKRINKVDDFYATKTYLSLPCGIDSSSVDQFQFSANFDLPFLNDEVYFELLLGSSNGVLCLIMSDHIVLFNPATREFKALPNPSFSLTNLLDLDLDLDSDSVDYTAALGFGFDPKTSDYKVVRIVEFSPRDSDDPSSFTGDSYPGSSYTTQVYNLSSNSWRQLETIVPGAFFYHPFFDAFFNGAWHWYVMCREMCSCGSRCFSCESILSFHISDEVFQNIPFPDICSVSDKCSRSLTVLNESLAFILYKDTGLSLPVDIQFDIWVMGEYGVKESWTFFHKIGPISSIYYPLAFWKDTELLMETSEGQLAWCNLHDQNVKCFQLYGVTDLEVAMYSESLVSIKSKDDATEESSDNVLHVVN